MPGIYTRFFANSRRSGAVAVSSAAKGRFAWSRRISRDAQVSAEARLLLSHTDSVIVDGMTELFVYHRDGELLSRFPRWYGCQIALEADVIYYLSAERKDRIEVRDLQGNLVNRDLRLPGLIDRSILVLFEPTAAELIAQVQFVGNPHDAPPYFMAYKSKLGDLWFDWSIDVTTPTTPIIPLVSFEQRRLLTANAGEILVLDLDTQQREPEPAARFPFPLEDATHWCSCSPEGNAYWCGRGASGIGICATDLNGALMFVVADAAAASISGRPVAPPLLGADRYWLLTTGNLSCFQRDKMLWTVEARETAFGFGTLLADNSVLVTAVNRLIRIGPEGETIFDVVFEEELNTPAVVDASGRVFVASKEMLYAFD